MPVGAIVTSNCLSQAFTELIHSKTLIHSCTKQLSVLIVKSLNNLLNQIDLLKNSNSFRNKMAGYPVNNLPKPNRFVPEH